MISLAEGEGRLVGHLAKQNAHSRVLNNTGAIVTFMGPHGYISPTWYESKGGVPTWNYAAVTVRGRCTIFTDKPRLKDLVERMSEKYEVANKSSWDMSYADVMLEHIVGLDLKIEDIHFKAKLSQNRTQNEVETIAGDSDASGVRGRILRAPFYL